MLGLMCKHKGNLMKLVVPTMLMHKQAHAL